MIEIVNSDINDITDDINNIDHNKVNLMNQILDHVHVFFDNERQEKLKEIKEIKTKYLDLKNDIKNKKELMNSLLIKYNHQKLLKDFYEKLEILLEQDISSSVKNELNILTKVIEKIPDKKIKSQINNLDKTLNQILTKK